MNKKRERERKYAQCDNENAKDRKMRQVSSSLINSLNKNFN